MGSAPRKPGFGRLDPRANDLTHGLAIFAVVWLAYAAGSRTSYAWFNADGLSATFFPAAGVTVSSLLLTRPRWWPVVLLAAASAELTMNLIHDLPPGAAAGYTLANTTEGLAGALLVRSATTSPDLRRMQDLTAFVLGAVVAAPAIGAAIGATTFNLETGESWSQFAGDWWVGDGLGVLVIGGAILSVAPLFQGERARELVGARNPVEAAAAIILTQALAALAFWTEAFALLFAPIGLLLLIAFRYGTLCVALAGAAVAFVAASATADGHVFTAGLESTPSDNILYLQLSLGFVIGTMLFLAAALRARDDAAAELAIAERRSSVFDITTALAAATTVDDVVEAYVRLGQMPLAAKAAMIAVAEGEQLQPVLTVGVEGGSRWSMVRWEGPVGDALRTGRRVSVSTAGELRERYPERASALLAEGFVSVASVPLPSVAGASPGAAGVAFTRPHRMSEREWQMLESLADATAQALARVRLIEAERQAHHASEVLRQLATALSRALTVEQVGSEFISRALAQLGGAAGALMLLSEDGLHLDLAVMSGNPEICERWRHRLPLEPPYVASAAFLERAPVQASGEQFAARFAATAERIGDVAKAMVALPLGLPGEPPAGAFGIAFTDEVTVGEDDLRLLEAMAAACLPALERARLTERTERRRRLADQLQQLAAGIPTGTDTEGLIAATAEQAEMLVGADRTVLALHDRQREMIRVRYGAPVPEQTRARWSESPASIRSPLSDVIESGQPVLVGTFDDFVARYPGLEEDMRSSEMRAVAAVAIGASGSRPIGVLLFAWKTERNLGEDLLDTMRSLASRCAAPLEQARRSLEQDRARGRAELLTSVMAELESVRGAKARAQRLTELLVPTVADFATVEAPDASSRLMAIAHANPARLEVLRELRERYALPAGNPDSVANVAGGGAQLISEITAERLDAAATDGRMRDLMRELGTRSHIAVPLTITRDRVGQTVLMLGISDPQRRLYGEHDLEFARELAQRAAIAIESARVLDEEHATAVRLQEALLPDRLADSEHVKVAAHYRGADERLQVGGDWYESIELPDGRLALAIGDIVGHGLEAAAGMGQLRTGFAALASGCSSPAELLDQLDAFAESIPAAAGSTVVCCYIDPSAGRLSYACAGHPPPVLVEHGRARLLGGGRSWPLASPVRGRKRLEDEIAISAGALLVLYSDGLVERRGERLTTGLERLRSAAEAWGGDDPDDLCSELLRGLEPPEGRGDDVVVLAAKLLPAPAVVFERFFPADAGQLAGIRGDLRDWMSSAGIADDDRQRILLAVGEACANAIEHGHRDGELADRGVELRILQHGAGDLSVTVTDSGSWLAAVADPDRGLGTPIMRRLAHDFERTTSGQGTRTSMRFLVRQDGSG